MKPIHWILLAGIGYYLYSKRGNATNLPGYHLMPQPDGSVKYMKDADHAAPGTWIFDQKTGLISKQGQKIDPGPAPIAIDPMEMQSDYGHSYLPM